MIILGIANFRRDAQSTILNLWVTAQRGYYIMVCNGIGVYRYLGYPIDITDYAHSQLYARSSKKMRLKARSRILQ
jgi:hypothetical protein